MFVTPVIYSAKIDVPLLQTIIYYNPLTYLICGPRDLILYGNMNGLTTLRWLDHKEKATSPNMKTNTKTKSPIENSLIHPDTTNPKEMNR